MAKDNRFIVVESLKNINPEDFFTEECKFIIRHKPETGNHSIFSQSESIDELKAIFNQHEAGWHGSMKGLSIHSPLLGSILSTEEVVGILAKWLNERE